MFCGGKTVSAQSVVPALAKPLAYVDRVIEGLPDEPPASTTQTSDTGPPRTWIVETKVAHGRERATDTTRGNAALSVFGVLVEHQQDYINYGSFSASIRANYRAQVEPGVVAGVQSYGPNQLASFRLSNTGFPINPETSVSTQLGDVGVVPLAIGANVPRLLRSSSVVRGATASLVTVDERWEANWGGGLRGNLQDHPYAAFVRWPGSAFWANGTVRFFEQGYAGAQLYHASSRAYGSASGALSRLPSTTASDGAVTSLLAVAGWGERDRTLGILPPQSGAVAVLASQRADANGGNGNGVLAHWRMQQDSRVIELGGQHVTPDAWVGDRMFANYGDGLNARYADRSARHSWSLGASALRTPATADRGQAQTWSVGGNWQWRLGRDEYLGLDARGGQQQSSGAQATASATSGSAPAAAERSAAFSARYQRPWAAVGVSTFTASATSNQQLYAELPAASSASVQWEQEWLKPGRSASAFTLKTVASIAAERSGDVRKITPSAGVSASWRPVDALSFGAEVRYVSPRTNLALERGMSGSLDALWKPGIPGLSVGLRVSANQAQFEPAILLQNPNVLPFVRNDGKSAWLWLRYELAAGSFVPPVGVRHGRALGAGEVTGIVYLDESGDGMRQLSERGLPNVDVVLDGRAVARTDSDGRFAFPMVAVGKHRVTLRLESIPLPWEAAVMSRVIDVELRGSGQLEFSLTRIRD